MDTNHPTDQVGGPCSKRLIDNRGRNHGCTGRLIAQSHVRHPQRPGAYLPDPDGDIIFLVCPRCGQSHGRAV